MVTSFEEVLKRLNAAARPDQLKGMSKFGIAIERRLGISIPNLRRMAKEVGKNHDLALVLWKTRIAEAMILASMIDNPKQLTEAQMEDWVIGFDSWDVCDQICDNLFVKSPLAWAKTIVWAEREEEFVKRAVTTARRIAASGSRAGRWVASDALRELEGEAVRHRLEFAKIQLPM